MILLLEFAVSCLLSLAIQIFGTGNSFNNEYLMDCVTLNGNEDKICPKIFVSNKSNNDYYQPR